MATDKMNMRAQNGMRLLIINPNSSQSVTDNLQQILPVPPQSQLTFYTGPRDAPPEIDGPETSHESCVTCLRDIKEKGLESRFDGYLVCCYSDHPLIYELRKLTEQPVLGIFQASTTYAMTRSPEKFGILTSTKSWEPILDEAVQAFFGGVDVPLFTGTVASDVNVLGLGDPENFKKLVKKTNKCVDAGSKTILLGCAGLSGMEGKLMAEVPGVKIVDSVKLGVELLYSLVRMES